MSSKPKFDVLILAAGLGTRMKSALPKVLHELAGKPLIIHAVENILSARPERVIIVVGHKAGRVEETVKRWAAEESIGTEIGFVRQKLLKGSGRAVSEAKAALKSAHALVMCGDTPFFSRRTAERLMETFFSGKYSAAVLTSVIENPGSYGRVMRNAQGDVVSIREAEGAGENELAVKEINSGVYFFKTRYLIKCVDKLKPKGPKKEYYLTDSVENMNGMNMRVAGVKTENFDETMGVNSRKDLAAAHKTLYARKAAELMKSGVTVIDPENTYVEKNAKIGRDTIVFPGSFVKGKSVVGRNCQIGPCAVLENASVGDNCEIKFSSMIISSRIRKDSVVGPFSHIRPESDIGPGARIGNFSEVKKSRVKKGSKVPHLSYIGDSEIGKNVNIGAGTITCNYDGARKHRTVIGDGVFVGSNTNFIAPVKIGKKSVIGAGSTITENVPANKLAIARARQTIKTGKRK